MDGFTDGQKDKWTPLLHNAEADVTKSTVSEDIYWIHSSFVIKVRKHCFPITYNTECTEAKRYRKTTTFTTTLKTVHVFHNHMTLPE